MKIEVGNKSSLSLLNLFFKRINMTNSGVKSSNEDQDAKVSFNLDAPVILNNVLTLSLNCLIEVEGHFRLEMCIVGEFGSDDEDFLNRMIPNAIAIMFPYLRSQVSLMTAQPNMPTLVLPPVNINSMIKKIVQQ